MVLAPPETIKGYALEEWRRLAPELPRLGLQTDLRTFASYCRAYDCWRTAQEALVAAAKNDPETDIVLSPLATKAAEAARVMFGHAVELGFTPAARARMGIHA